MISLGASLGRLCMHAGLGRHLRSPTAGPPTHGANAHSEQEYGIRGKLISMALVECGHMAGELIEKLIHRYRIRFNCDGIKLWRPSPASSGCNTDFP